MTAFNVPRSTSNFDEAIAHAQRIPRRKGEETRYHLGCRSLRCIRKVDPETERECVVTVARVRHRQASRLRLTVITLCTRGEACGSAVARRRFNDVATEEQFTISLRCTVGQRILNLSTSPHQSRCSLHSSKAFRTTGQLITLQPLQNFQCEHKPQVRSHHVLDR